MVQPHYLASFLQSRFSSVPTHFSYLNIHHKINKRKINKMAEWVFVNTVVKSIILFVKTAVDAAHALVHKRAANISINYNMNE